MPELAPVASLTVSDLAERTGLSTSTIRYYLREALVPAGKRLSRTRTLYDDTHVEALNRIKSLRASGVPIAEIRERAGQVADAPDDDALAAARRDELLDVATACFLSAGFAGTSLAAIARRASVSKDTLYRFFSSKEEVFMACTERVFHQLYADAWPTISQAGTPEERLHARWNAFVESFATWAPMMDLVRGLAIGNPAFRAESERLTDAIVAPIGRELSMIAADRRVDIDAEFLSYVVMGMAEAGSRAVTEGRQDADAVWVDMAYALAAWNRADGSL